MKPGPGEGVYQRRKLTLYVRVRGGANFCRPGLSAEPVRELEKVLAKTQASVELSLQKMTLATVIADMKQS